MHNTHELLQPQKEQEEIRRLITLAAKQERQDCYQGKRGERRFHASIRLEVMIEWADGIDITNATLHDISGGGMALWTRQVVQVRPSVFVREFTPEGEAVWVGTNLTHCTPGLNGFLIGAQFHHPVSLSDVIPTAETSPCESAACNPETPPKDQKKRGWRARLGLG